AVLLVGVRGVREGAHQVTPIAEGVGETPLDPRQVGVAPRLVTGVRRGRAAHVIAGGTARRPWDRPAPPATARPAGGGAAPRPSGAACARRTACRCCRKPRPASGG